jgi:hypothetical protein
MLHIGSDTTEMFSRGHLVDDAPCGLVVLPCQRAAMADGHRAFETVAELCLGNGFQGQDLFVFRLVHMQVDVEAVVGGRLEERIEDTFEVRQDAGGAAEQPAITPRRRDDAAEDAFVEHAFQRQQGDGLQRDPIFPFGAKLVEQREGDVRLRRDAIEMGADQLRAVGIGAFQ